MSVLFVAVFSSYESALSCLTQTVAITACLDNMGVMQYPVEHGAGQSGIAIERILPVPERQIGR